MPLLAGRRRPTTYAGRRYRRGVRSWRRAIRWKLVLVFGPVVCASVVWGVMEHHGAAYLAGWFGGLAAAAIVVLRDTPPAYLQTWGDGDAGEGATHEVLSRLGWRLIEDVACERGNYDHLLVGPPGVFLLDSKNWTGIISIVDGVPKLTRRHDPKARSSLDANVRNRVLAASAEVSRELHRRTGRRAWVNAVVVFWNDFPEGLHQLDKITYIHGSRLVEFLQNQPARLDDTAVATFADALTALQSATAPAEPTGPVPAVASRGG